MGITTAAMSRAKAFYTVYESNAWFCHTTMCTMFYMKYEASYDFVGWLLRGSGKQMDHANCSSSSDCLLLHRLRRQATLKAAHHVGWSIMPCCGVVVDSAERCMGSIQGQSDRARLLGEEGALEYNVVCLRRYPSPRRLFLHDYKPNGNTCNTSLLL